jgi:hypothetical protein
MTIKFNDESTWFIFFKNGQLIGNMGTGNDDCWKTPGVVRIKLESRKKVDKSRLLLQSEYYIIRY